MGKKQVGIFGGTFDPIHSGHLAIAESAKKEAGLDLVLFMVAGDPWQKAAEDVSPAEDRLLMVEAAVSNMPGGFEASNLEIVRGGPSYMVDTLTELKPMNAELFLILGSDVAGELETWERPQELKHLCRLIVVRRPGFEGAGLLGLAKNGWNVLEIEGPMLDISGTEIRKRLNAGLPVGDVLSDSVLKVIIERNIYGASAKAKQ